MEAELREVAAKGEITDGLRAVLQDMKATGVPRYEWDLLKALVHVALEQSLDAFRKEHPDTDPVEQGAPAYDAQKQRLLAAVDLFQGAPFTLQRLCELVLQPGMFYKNVAKLMFGLEKLLSVSSVLEVAQSPMADRPVQDGDAEMADAPGADPMEAESVSQAAAQAPAAPAQATAPLEASEASTPSSL